MKSPCWVQVLIIGKESVALSPKEVVVPHTKQTKNYRDLHRGHVTIVNTKGNVKQLKQYILYTCDEISMLGAVKYTKKSESC